METTSGIVDLATEREAIEQRFAQFSSQGLRTLGLAYRMFAAAAETSSVSGKEQESGMIFLGFVVLADPPKTGIVETIHQLRNLGVALKMITGDNRLVAGKQPSLQYLTMDEGIKHCTAGIGIWEWASNDRGCEPDVVMAAFCFTCCGTVTPPPKSTVFSIKNPV